MKALLASRNRGKVREIRKLLSPAGIDVVSLEELSHLGDVKENGATFAQNAVLKAVTMAERSGLLTFADDSGIEVDALGGEPGIYSARFAGEDSSDEEKNDLILRRLEGVEPSRRACGFRCVAAVATPCGKSVTFDGSVRGYVTKPRGECGFGYDPIFFYPPYGRTFGEVSLQMKNTVSHRGRAFSKLAEFISVFQGPLLLLGQEVNQ